VSSVNRGQQSTLTNPELMPLAEALNDAFSAKPS
jgi:hypothetical protein